MRRALRGNPYGARWEKPPLRVTVAERCSAYSLRTTGGRELEPVREESRARSTNGENMAGHALSNNPTKSFATDGPLFWLGPHSPLALSQLMRRVVDESLSGDLQVVSGSSVKTVRVNRGKVRYARSNLREDRLGESMLSHDFIDRRLFARASATMLTNQCRFGEALVKLGRLTEDELHRELAVQMQRIVLSLFRLDAGLYTFDKSEGAESDELPFALSVPPLLLKGLRRIRDVGELRKLLPEEHARVRVAREPLYVFEPRKLSALERLVLEQAGQAGNTIGEIVESIHENRAAARACCYSLLTVGLLETVPSSDEEQEHHEGPSKAALRSSYEHVRARSNEVRKIARDPSLVDKLDDIEKRLTTAYSRILKERVATEPANAASTKARRFQLERDARLHLQVKDFRGAIPLLQELVSLEPTRAPYRAMLAQSMQFHPSTRSNAEHHFVEAVRLDPNNVKLRLALAMYYKRTEQRARAVSAFEQVLLIDPRNETAQRFLLSIGEPTGVKALFKKIFG